MKAVKNASIRQFKGGCSGFIYTLVRYVRCERENQHVGCPGRSIVVYHFENNPNSPLLETNFCTGGIKTWEIT